MKRHGPASLAQAAGRQAGGLLAQAVAENPYLLPAFSLLLGLSAVYCPWTSFAALSLFATGLGLLLRHGRQLPLWPHALLAVVAALYAIFTAPNPSLPPDGIKGRAHISPRTAATQRQSGRPRSMLRGTLVSFSQEGSVRFRRLPCIVSIGTAQPPSLDCDYTVDGTLTCAGRGIYFLRPTRSKPWQAAHRPLSPCQMRETAKTLLQHGLSQRYRSPQVADFLSGMTLGLSCEGDLKYDLNRLGMQHLLVISGFHFALLAGLLSRFTRCLLPRRLSHGVCLIVLTAYFAFLGPSPAVMRAFLAAFLAHLALLLERSTRPLNVLAICCIATLLYEPRWIAHFGFQCSFALTASIVIFFPLVDRWQKRLLCLAGPNRLPSKAVQHLLLLLTPVRKALSLSIAVNIAAIPATLAFCGKVPLLGLAYNLVFPTLASGAVLLLLLAAAVEPIHSQTGLWLHHLNDRYTSSLMDLLHAPGRGSEGQLFAAPSPALVALVVAVLLLVGILRAQRERQKLLF